MSTPPTTETTQPSTTLPSSPTTPAQAPPSKESTGTASLVIGGAVPAGGDRIPVVCEDLGGGTLFVIAKDSAIVLTISLNTAPPPSLSMLTILDPDAGTLSNDGPFTVDFDGRTYRLAGKLTALGTDTGGQARAATITITC